MNRTNSLLLLGIITLLCILYVAMLPTIPQSLAYHNFADKRAAWGINNFANVVSNIPFLVTGLYGLLLLKRPGVSQEITRIYAFLFAGVLLTGLGSGYYHYAPDNNTLVYDRIPMVIVFMSFFSATITGWIDTKAGVRMLFPLLLLGIASVTWWHYTELKGHGDLRLYGFVQYFPMLIIPLIFLLFGSAQHNRGLGLLLWVMAWYGLAKIFELADKEIYQFTRFISGHSLKHLASAMATLYMVKFFERKYLHH